MSDRAKYQHDYRRRPEVRARKAAHSRSPRSRALSAERCNDWRSRNFARYLWHQCNSKAKRTGLPFDLTPEFVERLVAPMICSVTGQRLVIAPRGQRHPLLPSIDQIEPGGGYTAANVRLVSWIYNRARGSGTDEDVLHMALALINQSAMKSII